MKSILSKSTELLLFLGAIIISLLIAEMAARALHITPLQGRLERYAFDNTLGWTTKNSHVGFVSSAEYSHYLYYNQDGFPTDQAGLDQSASRNAPSIALLGDSFVEGYYLPYEKSLAAVLDQGTALQVLNFGVSGYSPGQYLLTARQNFDEYAITHIVVFLFPYNDIPFLERDDYIGYAKPLFDEPGGEPINLPLQVQRGKEIERGDLQGFLDKFALWSLLKPLVAQFVHLEDVITEPIKFTDEEIEKTLLYLNQIRLEYPDASFFVYYIPDLLELEQREVLDHNTWFFQWYCYQLELDCFQPFPFMDYENYPELYLPRDRHFSELGVQLIVEHLLAEIDLPPTSTEIPSAISNESD